MAFEKHKVESNFPITTATPVLPRAVVKLAGTSGLLAAPAATMADRPHYFNGAGTRGFNGQGSIVAETFAGLEQGQIVKAISIASCGVGVEVALASTNGALGSQNMISASGHWAVGVTLSAAAAGGEIFSVDFRPRKV